MSLVIGDTPEQLGSCLTADAVMIDGKIVTKQQVAELMAQVEMHRNAEIMWEKTMMQAIGEDGPGDVVKAIDAIKAERDNAWQELREIREAISANPEESTADEVRRVVAQKDNLHKAMEQFQAQSTHWHQQSQQLAAELAALAAFRDEVVGVMNNSQGVSGWHHNHTIATWDELFPVVPDFESPTQCLQDVKAEAGRAGVMHMHNILAKCYAGYGSESDSAEAELIADQYAASVKAGEA